MAYTLARTIMLGVHADVFEALSVRALHCRGSLEAVPLCANIPETLRPLKLV